MNNSMRLGPRIEILLEKDGKLKQAPLRDRKMDIKKLFK